MKKFGKKLLSGILAVSIIGTSTSAFAWDYKVQQGDTFWKISQKYDVDINKLMEVNNANESTILYVGQQIEIPETQNFFYYEVQAGDTSWIISEKFNVSLNELLKINNLNQYSVIYIDQKLKIPSVCSTEDRPTNNIPEQPESYMTYKTHIVKKGDDFWKLSVQYGIPMYELMKVNNANENTILYIGQEIKIPVYNVAEMETLGDQYGEYLDWWNGVQYVIPIGATIKVIDFYTGKSFMAKRTAGANHADVETLTAEDTEKLKEIWGGSFSWLRRPVIVEYNGRRIAGSASGMPHAGNDNAEGGVYTSWRSEGYGPGLNLDFIKNNNMDGHFDIHFLNSTRHKDGEVDEKHQHNIKISAGIID
ncbi:LysM peptidoglycan-binding domain-containing protein [Caldisalinibacter kiritimatiensis]|uniref:LysM domain-containing protein n=1 Tax=Caldisalinibacter kiritimatiensis TaxID=1304284 RepID=R1CLI4_9FIRM|nr:LysM peptidoglycan-binding domain-containing protein [Caldisalinibacter kiritimatiensis]EOC99545.1 hypothetical protein L21TH_2457 [Caldisalinibacter kiritimatiensis]